MKHKGVLLMKTILTALSIAALSCTAAQAQTKITAKGSDTMVILMQKWAEAYMAGHADVSIQVTGGGTGTGVAALQNNSTDLCAASRPLKSAEVLQCVKAFKAKPNEHKVALDGLAVYVHAQNPVKELSLAQLSDLFTGKITNWKEVGGADAPVVLYSRENSSGTYEFFKEHVLSKQDFAAGAQTMPGTAAVLQAVAKDVNGIGYGGAAYGAGAKHLAVKKDATSAAVEPNETTVQSGEYPISRPLFIYDNPAVEKGAIADFLAWVEGEEGQKVVKAVGFFSLRK
jgi:phosphate transport system substrate-binding protein